MNAIRIDFSSGNVTQKEKRFVYKSDSGYKITDSFAVASNYPDVTVAIIIIDKFNGTRKEKEKFIRELFKKSIEQKDKSKEG